MREDSNKEMARCTDLHPPLRCAWAFHHRVCGKTIFCDKFAGCILRELRQNRWATMTRHMMR